MGLMGREKEARELLNALSRRSRRTYVSPTDIGNIYIGLDELDSAVECLEKALERRCSRVTYLNVDPAYDVLMSDGRIIDLLRRMRLDSTQFE
jgi:hypothetical protein